MLQVLYVLEEVTGCRLSEGPFKNWKSKIEMKKNCLKSYKKISLLLKNGTAYELEPKRKP